MKKVINILMGLITLALLVSSCKSETYADKLKAEEKAINRFFDLNDIKLLPEYPTDHVFAENEFFREPTTGVYMNVINPGNDEKPIKGKTDVNLRYDTIYSLLTNDVESEPNWNSTSPMVFTYGKPSTYSNSTNVYSTSYFLLSQGCVVPLDYGLGNNAEVKLVIPFENGSAAQQSAYKPLYYTRLKYSFILDQPEE